MEMFPLKHLKIAALVPRQHAYGILDCVRLSVRELPFFCIVSLVL